MNLFIIGLNVVILAIGLSVIGVSSAAIYKLNHHKKNETQPNFISYWYGVLGVAITLIPVAVFFLMATTIKYMSRDTYLE